MNCGGRIYKGADVVISVPFNEEYSDLSLRIYTDGEYSIERAESACTIADGSITVTIEDYELELLKDGIIYYTINYTQDGLQLSETTNTPYVLKAQRGYSAQTPADIFQRGYEAGLEACEHPEMHLQDKLVYLDGSWVGSEIFYPDSGYVGMSSIDINANDFGEAAYRSGIEYQKSLLTSYETAYNGTFTNPNGWSSITVNVTPRLQDINLPVTQEFYEGSMDIYVSADTRYAGIRTVHLYDDGAYNYIHGLGEADGIEQVKSATSIPTFRSNGSYSVDETVDIPSYWKGVNVEVNITFSGVVTTDADYQIAGIVGGEGSPSYAFVYIDGEINMGGATKVVSAGTHTILVYGGPTRFGRRIAPTANSSISWTNMMFFVE